MGTVVIRTNGMWKSTNRKNSCSALDTNDLKIIDTSYESPECRLQFEISNTSKNGKVNRLLGMMFESGTLEGNGRMEDLVLKKIQEFFLHFTP